jgi:hypothetical protein
MTTSCTWGRVRTDARRRKQKRFCRSEYRGLSRSSLPDANGFKDSKYRALELFLLRDSVGYLDPLGTSRFAETTNARPGKNSLARTRLTTVRNSPNETVSRCSRTIRVSILLWFRCKRTSPVSERHVTRHDRQAHAPARTWSHKQQEGPYFALRSRRGPRRRRCTP